MLRSSLIDGENEDFVRTARSKGLTERRVLLRHLLRTSMITFVSLFGLDFGALVAGGALLTEVVFGLPGVGKLTYDSLQNLDLPVILATVMYAAFFIVLANAVVDIVYGLLDPRVRVELAGRSWKCATCTSPSAPRTGSYVRSTASPSASWPAGCSASSASPARARVSRPRRSCA